MNLTSKINWRIPLTVIINKEDNLFAQHGYQYCTCSTLLLFTSTLDTIQSKMQDWDRCNPLFLNDYDKTSYSLPVNSII